MRQKLNPPNLPLPPKVGGQGYPGPLQSLLPLLLLAGLLLQRKKVALLSRQRKAQRQSQEVRVRTYILIFLAALYNRDAVYSYSLC